MLPPPWYMSRGKLLLLTYNGYYIYKLLYIPVTVMFMSHGGKRRSYNANVELISYDLHNKLLKFYISLGEGN